MPNPLDFFLKAPTPPAQVQPLPQQQKPDTFTNIVDFLLGAAGLPGLNVPGGDRARAAGELLTAGIPFAAGKRVFHGTGRVFDKFKPGSWDGLIHAAENPAHAAAFAHSPGSYSPNMIPLELDVKNALDLTPQAIGSVHGAADAAGDIRKLEAVIPPEMLSDFKRAKTYWRSNDPEAQFEGRSNLTRMLVDRLLKQNPTALSDAGFDGIRYLDGADAGAAAWAVPDPNQLINAFTKERGVGNLPGITEEAKWQQWAKDRGLGFVGPGHPDALPPLSPSELKKVPNRKK